MKNIKTLNPENASEEEIANFKTREAVRAIVYDKDGKIAVLHVTKQNYYKLPGGGVEEGENVYNALKRECREELGCNIETYGEVGQVIEYRKMYQLKQISPCYLARVVGEKGKPSFTEEEAEDGFEIQWLPLEKAIPLFIAEKALNEEGRLYIVPRDKTFLEAVKNK